MLYVVATPIGNLGDISPRALEILRSVALIAAEDTRVTAKVLSRYGITTPLVSVHRHNEAAKAAPLADRMVSEGIDVAVVTDAGTPAVSDPGADLVREAAARGIEVQPIPGCSAAVAAVSISGFGNVCYTFLGFLPRERGDCLKRLKALAGHTETAVIYESPHRVKQLVKNVGEVYPECEICLSCDLTKLYEKTLRGTAREVLAALESNPKAEKGEYVMCLDLAGTEEKEDKTAGIETMEARLLDAMLANNIPLRDAMDILVKEGHKKNAVYQGMLRLKDMLKNT